VSKPHDWSAAQKFQETEQEVVKIRLSSPDSRMEISYLNVIIKGSYTLQLLPKEI
jgi:hypothetical protein